MTIGMHAATAIEFDVARVETQRWFLTLALADFIEARSAVREARECGQIGETWMQVRASEMAALFYARPFHDCITPSGRSCLKLPSRFVEDLDSRLAGIHTRTVGVRNQVVEHRDLGGCRLKLCVSSNHRTMEFGAALLRPAPPSSELGRLAELIDRLIQAIQVELAAIVVQIDPKSITLIGIERTIVPAEGD